MRMLARLSLLLLVGCSAVHETGPSMMQLGSYQTQQSDGSFPAVQRSAWGLNHRTSMRLHKMMSVELAGRYVLYDSMHFAIEHYLTPTHKVWLFNADEQTAVAEARVGASFHLTQWLDLSTGLGLSYLDHTLNYDYVGVTPETRGLNDAFSISYLMLNAHYSWGAGGAFAGFGWSFGGAEEESGVQPVLDDVRLGLNFGARYGW